MITTIMHVCGARQETLHSRFGRQASTKQPFYSRLYTTLPKLELSWSNRDANASPCSRNPSVADLGEGAASARANTTHVVQAVEDVLDRAGELATRERGRDLAVELAEEVLVHALEDDEALVVLRTEIGISRHEIRRGEHWAVGRRTSSFPTTIMVFLIGYDSPL